MESIVLVMMTIASALFSGVSASTNHTIAWHLSSNISTSTTVFRVGDILEFSYSPFHRVLEVNHVEYSTCSTQKPIHVYSGGKTVIHLTQPGRRFFIGGRTMHCAMGLRIRVDVLAPNTSWIVRPRPYPTRPPPRPTFPDLPDPLQIVGYDNPPQSDVAAGPSRTGGAVVRGIRRWFHHWVMWVVLVCFSAVLSYFVRIFLNKLLALFASNHHSTTDN